MSVGKGVMKGDGQGEWYRMMVRVVRKSDWGYLFFKSI